MELAQFIRQYVESVRSALANFPVQDAARVLEVLADVRRADRRIFLAGNGGSAATASHMANDLVKGVAALSGRGFRAHVLSDNIALVTAIANDIDYREVFSRQLATLGQPGDVLIVLSGSGNSPNIVRAVEEARRIGMQTVAVLGMNGGEVSRLVDFAMIVSSHDYGHIEDVHLVFNHLVAAYFGTNNE